MYVWAAYVILVAVALADQMVPADRWYSRPLRAVFEFAYGLGRAAYLLGIMLLILAAAFFLLPIIVILVAFLMAETLLTKDGRKKIRTAWTKRGHAQRK